MNARAVARRSRLFPNRGGRTRWQPGIVEVRFSSDVKPQVIPAGENRGMPTVRSLGGIDLSKFHKVATKYAVSDIRPMAGLNAPGATEGEKRGQEWFDASLGDYVELQFDRNAAVEQIAREFAALREVTLATPSPIASRATLPNDTHLGTSDQLQAAVSGLENQWYIFHCHANDAWELTGPGGSRINGQGVNLAIVDEAFDANHEDLRTHVKQRFNAITGDNNISQLSGNNRNDTMHGTAVAGLAGAIGNNNLGICGFAWNSDLWLVQSMRNPDQASEQPQNRLLQGLVWVGRQTASQNARTVVNVSMGISATPITPQSPADIGVTVNGQTNHGIRDAIQALITGTDTNAVVCIAAGNDEQDQSGKDVSTDADGNSDSGSDAIVVGAMYVDAGDNVRYPSSNWGPRVTLCAPGDREHDMTCSAGIDGPYRTQFGQTSGATPKVAGTAALMLQANPNLTHDMVKAILNGSGIELTKSRFQYDRPVGPMLNTLAAVQAAAASTTGPKLICNRFLNFGSVNQGTTPAPTLSVSVFNIGSQPLQLNSFDKTADSSDRFSLSSAFASTTINPGTTVPVTIPIQFTPNSRNDVRATFNLVSNDPASPTTPILCTGTAPISPKAKAEIAVAVIVGGAIIGYIIFKLLQYFNVIKSS
jgi:subtilisin family serine protease